MSFVKNTSYINMPFCTETSSAEFFSYSSLKDLAVKCETFQGSCVTRCRTIGILQSLYGKFYLSELDPEARKSSPVIQLSLIYLKSPVPSTTTPTAVQVFGFLQWRNKPIIYVKLLQVLSIPMALRIRKVMNNIAVAHNMTEQAENPVDIDFM